MYYLIDGYNLLHETDVFTNAVGPKSLAKLHEAFLDYLATALGPDASGDTTVVFDARGRRATSRRTLRHQGITVHYASNAEDADHLIAEIVAAHHAPRQLTVVSSDHQVQRAAKRRRAKAIDSGQWYLELRRKHQNPTPPQTLDDKPVGANDLHDAAWWLAQFDAELLRDLEEASRSKPLPSRKQPPISEKSSAELPANAESDSASGDPEERAGSIPTTTQDNPFPPEYIAEIIREVREHEQKLSRAEQGKKMKRQKDEGRR